jgi:uncharacterized membrane protein YkoI
MTQRLMFVISAGVAAFVVVTLTALVVYLFLGSASNTTAFASQGNTSGTAFSSSPQQSAPGGPSSPNNQGAGGPGGQSGYTISSDDAANIALSSVPGASIAQQPRLVDFNGTVAYEVQLNAGYVYVDAQSGQVIHNQANGTQSNPPRQRFHRR